MKTRLTILVLLVVSLFLMGAGISPTGYAELPEWHIEALENNIEVWEAFPDRTPYVWY